MSHSNHSTSNVRWWPIVLILAVGLPTLAALMRTDFSWTRLPLVDLLLALALFEVLAYVWLSRWSRLRPQVRATVLLVCLIVKAVAVLTFFVDGFSGDTRPIVAMRWTFAPQTHLVGSLTGSRLPEVEATAIDLTYRADRHWPGLRGADRSGIVEATHLSTDWNSNPPTLLWRHPVGLGWSSFAVAGDYCITQEQRGEFESVVCYELETGRERWVHADRAYFQETMGGDGPRATPTIHDGCVYTMGATGILNCLDGSTGLPQWSTNVLDDAKTKNIEYGMAGSPLVVDSLVVVNSSGPGNALVAYDTQTGRRIWAAGDALPRYSSPMVARLAGKEQILTFNAQGLFAHDPTDGRILWHSEWRTPPQDNNSAQPVPLPSGDPNRSDRVLISSGYGTGCGLLEIERHGEEYFVATVWENRNLRAKFTSMIQRDGFLYGMDETILVCLDLQTGHRRWKRGRYGFGQMLLVDNLLLIQAESGDVALVEASPEAYLERARFSALDHRTWNHPVLVGRLLLVRNDREAACYRLP